MVNLMMNLQWVRANLMVNIFICNKLIIHLTVYQLFYTIYYTIIYIYYTYIHILYAHIYIYIRTHIHMQIYAYIYLPILSPPFYQISRAPGIW